MICCLCDRSMAPLSAVFIGRVRGKDEKEVFQMIADLKEYASRAGMTG